MKEVVIRMAAGESPCSVIGQEEKVVVMGEATGRCDDRNRQRKRSNNGREVNK